MSLGIVWFRQDLRIKDNPALAAACRENDSVICVFIDDPTDQTISRVGDASRVWLHFSLMDIDENLQKKGSSLHIFKGTGLDTLQGIMEVTKADRLYWNRCYDPVTIERDKQIKSALSEYTPTTFNGSLIFEPWENLKNDGTAYRVYTPFWRAAAAQLTQNPELLALDKAPSSIPVPEKKVLKAISNNVALEDLGLLPENPWYKGMMSHWQVGESAAARSLSKFLKKAVNSYHDGRNLPSQEGTSRLSPHLHFGEISPRTALVKLLGGRELSALSEGEETFAKEIIWREFAYCLLFHFPHTIDSPLDKRFERFEWATDTDEHLSRWQRGMTGVPIVDAGMRELYATGWMHNRVRMIVASYLIKNLLIPWQSGEAWFRDTLVDADLASNSMGWQWTAGCGADAAPFFRVFNPVLQGEKFDKQGAYVSRWVPELAKLPDKFIHKPWELSVEERAKFDYPQPLVDLKVTRERALKAFAGIKGTI